MRPIKRIQIEYLVGINGCELNICGVFHNKTSKEFHWTKSGTASQPHDGVETYLAFEILAKVTNELSSMCAFLKKNVAKYRKNGSKLFKSLKSLPKIKMEMEN